MMRLSPIKYGVKIVPPTDPYAAYVVSQMRGDSLYNDETGKLWQTVTGTPVVSTAVGNPSGAGSALYFDGASSLGLPHTSDLNIQGIDATLELWVYIPNAAGLPAHQIIHKSGWPFSGANFVEGASPRGDASSGWRIQAFNNLMNIQVIGTGANQTSSISNGVWTHYEVGFTPGLATKTRTFIDGVLSQSDSITVSNIDQAISMIMGGPLRNNKFLTGYVANWRMTAGVCRHTSNFTPETVLPTL